VAHVAKPKSQSLASPVTSSIRTFADLMSRWIQACPMSSCRYLPQRTSRSASYAAFHHLLSRPAMRVAVSGACAVLSTASRTPHRARFPTGGHGRSAPLWCAAACAATGPTTPSPAKTKLKAHFKQVSQPSDPVKVASGSTRSAVPGPTTRHSRGALRQAPWTRNMFGWVKFCITSCSSRYSVDP
jgi:hypothetical protein